MSNEMPEKIWVGRHEDEGALGLGTLHVPRFKADFPELTEYTRTDTIPDITELRRQLAALKEYVMMVTDLALMEVPVDIIDIALEKEILKDVGENIGSRYAYPDWMLTDTAAMPAPSKAEVAREFFDAALQRRDKTCETFLVDASNVLGELEANEVNDAESN